MATKSDWARGLADRVVKTDSSHSAMSAKVEIRRRLIDRMRGEKATSVFDAFAGRGEFHRAVWREADSYTGCDLRYFPDERRAFVADNLRVMRAIDLSAFNIFDLDAYGSPWHQAFIIASRRKVKPGELIALAITEGNGFNYKNNVVPHAVTALIGLRHGRAVGLHHRRDEVIAAILAALARKMDAEIVQRWQAQGRSGSWVMYLGVVLRGNKGD
jgi:hypothetical protein